MKRFILLLSAGFLVMVVANAQKPENAQVMVHYKFSHLRDTTHRDQPLTAKMVLVLGKNVSVYKIFNPHEEEQSAGKGPGGGPGSPAGGPPQVVRTEYFQYANDKKLFTKESLLFNDFLIPEVLPVIKWQIMADTARFGGFHCQKATGRFKGRDYTAWFCPDLPFHAGPYKLNGLPGVILEAYDSKREVSFLFDGIEKVTSPIKLPETALKTTASEFSKLKETFLKDPEAFARSMTGPQNGKGPQMHIDIKPGPGPVINNPIELPEK